MQRRVHLSWATTAEGHHSEKGSGFQAYALSVMPLNLYMCQWLWFKKGDSQFGSKGGLNDAAMPNLVFDMTQRCLTCQGGGTDPGGWWVAVSISKIQKELCVGRHRYFQSFSAGHRGKQKSRPSSFQPIHLSIHLSIQHMLPGIASWLSRHQDRDLHPWWGELLTHVQRVKGNTCSLSHIPLSL